MKAAALGPYPPTDRSVYSLPFFYIYFLESVSQNVLKHCDVTVYIDVFKCDI